MQRHILVVDDDRDILQFLELVLRESGCRVSCVEQAQAALALLEDPACRVDLVLSDVRMPQLGGIALLEKLAARHPQLPVVLMTAFADLDVSLQAIRAGAMDLVLKPITARETERILARLDQLETRNYSAEELADPLLTEAMTIRVPSQRAFVRKALARALGHFGPALVTCGFKLPRIRVCLAEALENALVHGNLEVDSRLKEEDWEAFEGCVQQRQADAVMGRREIECALRLDSEAFQVRVRNQGPGFDLARLDRAPDADALMNSGRGVLLIRSIMDEVAWEDAGRCIVMRKRLGEV